MIYKEIALNEFGDERGRLVIAESNKDIPFEIKRIFYIYGTEKDTVRGQHANRNSEFVFLNIKGSSKILIDDGKEKRIIELDKPNKGLYINKMVWKDMYDFSDDSILLVLSSELYDAKEYIRNYDEFIMEVSGDK